MDNNGDQKNTVCGWVSGPTLFPAHAHKIIANQIEGKEDYDIVNPTELEILEELLSYLVIPKSLDRIPNLKTFVLHICHKDMRPIISNSITKIDLTICQSIKDQPAIDFSGTPNLSILIISTRAVDGEIVVKGIPKSLKELSAQCVVLDCDLPLGMDSVVMWDSSSTTKKPIIDAKKVVVSFPFLKD